MIFDELYARYDGHIPSAEKAATRLGSYAAYTRLFLQQAEKGFAERCRYLVQSLIAWRLITRYESGVREEMLDQLSGALAQSRKSARYVFELRR